MHVIDIIDAELITSLAEQAQDASMTDAVIVSLVGVVDRFTLLTTSAVNQRVTTNFDVPGEIAGAVGHIRDGKAHLHATLGLPDAQSVAGHLEQAAVRRHFARVFLLPVDESAASGIIGNPA
ncbi:PCC domain-containing protein [Streptomyces phaeochromogenes]|uniref:PCC domain-containing protein n=1 Tax=Streptomyces phaeochromogenes TaxID=1923 RepID=UPI003679D6EE